MSFINRVGKLIDGVIKISDLINMVSFHIRQAEDHSSDDITMIDIVKFDSSRPADDRITHSLTYTLLPPTKTFSDSITHSTTKNFTTGRTYTDLIIHTPSKLFHVVKQCIESVNHTIIKTISQPEYPDNVTYTITPTIMQLEYPVNIAYTSTVGISQSKNIEPITYTPSYIIEHPDPLTNNVNYSFTLWTNQPTYTDKISHRFYLTLTQG